MRMEACLIFIILVVGSFITNGGKSDTLQGEWNKTYGGDEYDLLYYVEETNDNGYIAAGVTTQHNFQYVWLLKLDENGNVEWERKEMGNDVYIQPTYVEETNDGYIVCGVFNSPDAKFGKWKGFLWKLDNNGNTQWIKAYYERLWVVLNDDAGGYVVVGYDALSNDDYDAVLMKMDENGDIQWKKLYRYGVGYDEACSLAKTEDGYIMGGYVSKNNDLDFWLIKTDKNGSKQWSRTYGGVKDDYSVARNIFETSDGYIMVGITKSFGKGKNDIWLIKTDKNGNMIWNKTFGGKGEDRIWGMDKTSDGYLLCITKGYSQFGTADIWIVKVDENGDMLWNQTFGGEREDRGYYIQATKDGGYIVAGRTESFSSSSDGWLIKVENVPPNKPQKPQGEANGKINHNYTYTTTTIDSNEDEVYYMFDWGDNTTSQWIGPFKSGEIVEASHIWKEQGTYRIRVKAKDTSGLESPWSDYMVVSMPYRARIFNFIYTLLKFFFSSFLPKLLLAASLHICCIFHFLSQ